MNDRGVSPVIGVVLLVAITIALAGVLATGIWGIGLPGTTPPTATIDGHANETSQRITLIHAGGDRLNVSELIVEIRIDDEPIPHQPPVPFAGATGYRGAPSGAFNSATSPDWSPGERTSLTLSRSNAADLTSGATVTVQFRTPAGLITSVEFPVD